MSNKLRVYGNVCKHILYHKELQHVSYMKMYFLEVVFSCHSAPTHLSVARIHHSSLVEDEMVSVKVEMVSIEVKMVSIEVKMVSLWQDLLSTILQAQLLHLSGLNNGM